MKKGFKTTVSRGDAAVSEGACIVVVLGHSGGEQLLRVAQDVERRRRRDAEQHIAVGAVARLRERRANPARVDAQRVRPRARAAGAGRRRTLALLADAPADDLRVAADRVAPVDALARRRREHTACL